MRLHADGTAAIYDFQLPVEVYRHSVTAGLADLRVLNGRGESLPYAVVHRDSSSPLRVPVLESAPMFPLWGDAAQLAPGVSLDVHSGATGIQLSVPVPADRAQRLRGYVLDLRHQPKYIVGLDIDFADDSKEFSELVVLQASDDLASWRDVARAPLVNLRFDGNQLTQRRIEFARTRASYWRLMWPPGREATTLRALRVMIAPDIVEPPRSELRVVARAEPGKPREYRVDLGGRLPVDRVNVELPERNTVSQNTLESRSRADEPWHVVISAAFFRLSNGSGSELQNPPLDIAANRDRYWKITVGSAGGGVGAGMPSFVVRWLPETLRFVARGPSPYELVFGSAVAGSAEAPLSSLSMAPVAGDRASIQGVATTADAMVEAGGPSKLVPPPPPPPWKKWILWAVLGFGVALLAWFAWRLNGELMNPPERRA